MNHRALVVRGGGSLCGIGELQLQGRDFPLEGVHLRRPSLSLRPLPAVDELLDLQLKPGCVITDSRIGQHIYACTPIGSSLNPATVEAPSGMPHFGADRANITVLRAR